MFKVISTKNGHWRTEVYAVRTHEDTGEILFLVFDGSWKWELASKFAPYYDY